MPKILPTDILPVNVEDLASAIGECLIPGFEEEITETLSARREGWARVNLGVLLQPARRALFDDSCALLAPVDQIERLGQLDIYKIGEQTLIRNVQIVMANCNVRGMIGFGRSDARMFFGERCSAYIDIRAWRNARLFVGASATINKARLVIDDAMVGIGDDAMLSDEILIQAGDQHSIWSLETLSVINRQQKPVLIGEHAWIGRRATVMAGGQVGCGSIVGAGSLVTGIIDPFCLAVGSPARAVRQDVSWSRNIDMMTGPEKVFINRRSKPNNSV